MVKKRAFKAGDLFIIKSNPQLNKESFHFNKAGYPYFTRTAFNNGVLGYVDYLDEEHKIKGNSLAIGMIEMRFHYMERDFYAGQFTKTAFPTFSDFNEHIALYFITLFGKFQKTFQGILIRDFEKTFSNLKIELPIGDDNQIDFSYMEDYIRGLEKTRLRALETYFNTKGLSEHELTDVEKKLAVKAKYKTYNIIDIFDVKNTQSIMSRDVIENSGTTPYLTAGAINNAVGSYIQYDERCIDKGNCIFIGGKTFVVTYQENDFYSNDSHNLALYLKEDNKKTRENQLFMATAIYNSLCDKYSWGNSISKKKIQADTVSLPVDGKGNPDYDYMIGIYASNKRWR